MRKPNLSIDISLTNSKEDEYQSDKFNTTYRAEGLSIGRDYLRFQGSTISASQSLDQYIVDEVIGTGTSSVVRRAKLKNGGTYYALKVFALSNQSNKIISFPGDDSGRMKQSSMLIQEIKLMCQLQCSCLVQMVGAFYEPARNVTMVLEYMDYGSLTHFLRLDHYSHGTDRVQPRLLPEKAIAALAFQILRGLAYLHHENILHRDIKPSNILINSLGQVKVSDLGISGLSASAMAGTSCGLNHTVVGTSKYMSPERLLDKAYGPSSDIWSFGLVLIESATGGWNPLCYESEKENKGPKHRKGIRSIVELAMILDEFCIDNVLSTMADGVTSKINWGKEIHKSDGVAEILRWSLQRSPEKRIPAKIMLDSPWFRNNEIDDVGTAQSVMKDYFTSLPENEQFSLEV